MAPLREGWVSLLPSQTLPDHTFSANSQAVNAQIQVQIQGKSVPNLKQECPRGCCQNQMLWAVEIQSAMK